MMGNRKLLCQVLFGASVAGLGLGLGIGACSDDSNNGAMSGAGAATAAGAGVSAAGAGSLEDDCSESYQHFAVGPSSTVASDAKSPIAVRVLDGQVPPAFGSNTWTIQLLDAATMQPAPNARLTWQCAFMRVHGHGSNPKSLQNLGNGQYKLVDMNMRMFGPWEVQFWIDPTGQMPEYVPTSNIINGMACTPTSGVQGEPTIQIKACVPRSSD
jgi:hypothetical protein